MKPWHWVLLAGGALVVIVIIMKTAKPANGAANPSTSLTAAAGLGGLLAGLFKGGNKVSAPSGTAGSIPGDTGYSYNGLSGQQYGAGYSAAMGGTGYSASESAGSGAAAGAAAGAAGYSASEAAGSGFLGQGGYTPSLVGPLTAPSFDVGTGGATFSN